jgi:hypothetical protein
LYELSAWKNSRRSGCWEAAIGLGLPAIEDDRNSISLSGIGIVHDVEMKMRFG